MNVQEQIKVLKEQISASEELISKLEEQVKKEQEFPKIGDTYWRIGDKGSVDNRLYNDYYIDKHRQAIGNFFQTEEQAEFALEKLKVEAELRKYSGPFELMKDNFFIIFNMQGGCLATRSRVHVTAQGAIYFESEEKTQQAIHEVGEERIKKYIFGVEG